MIGMADNKLTSFKKYEPNFLDISCIFLIMQIIQKYLLSKLRSVGNPKRKIGIIIFCGSQGQPRDSPLVQTTWLTECNLN